MSRFTPDAVSVAVVCAAAILLLAAVAMEGLLAAVAMEGAQAEAAPAGGLVVADEWRCEPYTKGDYRHRASVESAIAEHLGGVWSPYTGEEFYDAGETDIEHIVATSEAHDSGLCAADAETRRQFANDLLNLTLASPSLNRYDKRGEDPAGWLPDENRCWFVGRVVAVKTKYRLTVDGYEARAIMDVLDGCETLDLEDVR